MDLVTYEVPLNSHLCTILWSIKHTERFFQPLPLWIITAFADLNNFSIKEADHINRLSFLWASDILKLTNDLILSWNLNEYEHVKMLPFSAWRAGGMG